MQQLYIHIITDHILYHNAELYGRHSVNMSIIYTWNCLQKLHPNNLFYQFDFEKLNPKKVGGKFDRPLVIFRKLYFLERGWSPGFFSRIFHLNSWGTLKNMKIFFVNINYFHQFFRFCDISLLQKSTDISI